ncbi:hypothetical protein ACFV29_23120 [Streptomyces sp. NPDC059690]|uniref:hypothetical protein n=1 Tax=Streptomyces sp. NPDC059690 TaxID=3346907 RepID=UPI0036C76F51
MSGGGLSPGRVVRPAGAGGGPDRTVDAVVDRVGRLDHLALCEVRSRAPGMPPACVRRAGRRRPAAHGGPVVDVIPDGVRERSRDTALAGLPGLAGRPTAEPAPGTGVHTVMTGPPVGANAYRRANADPLCGLPHPPRTPGTRAGTGPGRGPSPPVTGRLTGARRQQRRPGTKTRNDHWKARAR